MSCLKRLRLLVLFISLALLHAAVSHAVVTTIAGKSSWWAVNDHIRFVGDCQTSNPTNDCGTCSGWCSTDMCLAFRKVTSVDAGACTATDATPVLTYGCIVDGCFFLGGTLTYGQNCSGCETHNYCGSIWKITNKTSTPGATWCCYALELVCPGSGGCVRDPGVDDACSH